MLPLKNLDLIPSKSNKILTWTSLKFIFGESRLQKCNFYAFWGNRWSFYIFIWLEISCNNLEFNSNVLIQFGLNFQNAQIFVQSDLKKNSHFINQTYLKLIIFGFDSDLLYLNFGQESVCHIQYVLSYSTSHTLCPTWKADAYGHSWARRSDTR